MPIFHSYLPSSPNVLSSDVSSGNLPMPVGSANRSVLGELFNPNAIAREDWLRSEQSAQLSHERSLAAMREQNQFNAEQSQMNRDFNAAEAQKQRDYEAELANTQYQRAMKDLKAAGLNPVLALSSGADVPSGSAASGSAASSSGYGGNSSNYRGTSAGRLNQAVLHGIVSMLSGQLGASVSLNREFARGSIQLANDISRFEYYKKNKKR